jgi:tetratricopeptide (TPR) repeat protein
MESYRSEPEYAAAMQTYLTGDREESRKVIETLLKKNPDDPTLLLLLGNIKYTLGLLGESAAHYERAIQVDPGFCQAYFKLGVCYVRMGKLNEALRAFRKNLESGCSGHTMSNYWIGLINNFLGNDDEALEAFTILHRESKESQLANFFLAQLLMKRNRHAEALVLLNDLLTLTPDFAEVHFLIGQAYAGQYRTMEAIQSFRKTLELNPSDKRAQLIIEQYTGDSPH